MSEAKISALRSIMFPSGTMKGEYVREVITRII